MMNNLSQQALGKHMLAEYYFCDTFLINNIDFLKLNMMEAAELAGATIVNTSFHTYSPYGVSGIVVVMESHFAIHTWPEHGYAAIDFFTCSEKMDFYKAYQFLAEKLQAQSCDFKIVDRGVLSKINERAPELKNHFEE